jgi:hypothetical protein
VATWWQQNQGAFGWASIAAPERAQDAGQGRAVPVFKAICRSMRTSPLLRARVPRSSHVWKSRSSTALSAPRLAPVSLQTNSSGAMPWVRVQSRKPGIELEMRRGAGFFIADSTS